MGGTKIIRRVVSILVAAVALTACCAATAGAIGLSNFSAVPDDTTAGAHSDLTTTFDLAEEPPQGSGTPGNETKDIRDLQLDLPAGLLPNPSIPAMCQIADFEADNCPAASEVGSTQLVAFAFIGVELPVPVFGTVYNLQNQPDEPARLGIVVRPLAVLGSILGKIYLQAPIRIRDEGDYGLTATVQNIPNKLSFIDIRIARLTLTINAQSPNGYFETNPTSCIPATSRLAVTDYEGVVTRAESTFTPTDCAGVDFLPRLNVSSSESRTDTPTEVSVDFGQPRDSGNRITSMVKAAQFRLADGYTLNPALAPGLGVCTDEAFGQQGDPDNCPASSQVGTVDLTSPLIGVLPGKVFFSKNAENPYRLFIIGQARGVTVKLKTTLVPNNDTGQITVTFPDIPQVSFTNFNLKFFGGPTGGAVSPLECGSVVSNITGTPWSGQPDETVSAPANTFSTDGAGNCNPTINPSLAAATSTKQGKADTSLALDLGRQERDRPPKTLDVALPQGFLGRIFSIPFCPDSVVDAGTGACPENSKVGTVTAAIGSGPATASLTGTAYLAGSTNDDLARLLLVIPAKIGPIDLGTYVQVADLNLGETDQRVHITTQLPPVFKGIPLRLRRLQVGVDRQGFLFNPTGCDVRTFDAKVGVDPGLVGNASFPYQAENCGALSFSPALSLNVPGTDARDPGDATPLEINVANVSDGSALKRAQVVIPRSLRADTDVLTKVCQANELAAKACPASTQIGTAYARTPLLPYPLTGPVYIAQTGRTPTPRAPLMLPYAVALLQGGPVKIRIDGSLALSTDGGRLDGLFDNLPDVPLDEFKLSFDKRNFQTISDLCSTTRGPADAELDAQSTKQLATQSALTADACGDRAAVRMSARGLASTQPTGSLSFVRNPRAGKLTGIDATLPSQLRPTGSERRVTVVADGKKVSGSRFSITTGRRIRVRLPGSRAATKITVSMKRGSLRTTSKIRRRAKRDLRKDKAASVRLSVTGASTDSGQKRPSLTVRFDALARR